MRDFQLRTAKRLSVKGCKCHREAPSVMRMKRNDAQISLRMPTWLRGRLETQAREHHRVLAAEVRAAAELSTLVRAVFLLRNDAATKARLGVRAAEAERAAQVELDHLCQHLFGRRGGTNAVISRHEPP